MTKMIHREMSTKLLDMAKKMPVIGILGPRQSGKTTLARALFKDHTYVSLEDLDIREFATTDPRGFIEHYGNAKGVIFDEIQRTPTLLSYIQTHVDKNKKMGFFILTGSQNFLIHSAVTQTLAGRIALFTLLPLSLEELQAAEKTPKTIEELLFKGLYPRLYDVRLTPAEWYPSYIRTYIERDVRLIRNVTNLTSFQQFMKLCAGRIGQILNLSSLANDCGISTSSAKNWISLLQASYILFCMHPHYKNFRKRLIKAPKLYFYDTGLACSLLGIDSVEQLSNHYLKGGLFESFVISDILKRQYNLGLEPHVYFWRDKVGHEIDCVVDSVGSSFPIEIKAGKTISKNYFDNLVYWNAISGTSEKNNSVIYAGTENQERMQGSVFGWQHMSDAFKKIGL